MNKQIIIENTGLEMFQVSNSFIQDVILNRHQVITVERKVVQYLTYSKLVRIICFALLDVVSVLIIGCGMKNELMICYYRN